MSRTLEIKQCFVRNLQISFSSAFNGTWYIITVISSLWASSASLSANPMSCSIISKNKIFFKSYWVSQFKVQVPSFSARFSPQKSAANPLLSLSQNCLHHVVVLADQRQFLNFFQQIVSLFLGSSIVFSISSFLICF